MWYNDDCLAMVQLRGWTAMLKCSRFADDATERRNRLVMQTTTTVVVLSATVATFLQIFFIVIFLQHHPCCKSYSGTSLCCKRNKQKNSTTSSTLKNFSATQSLLQIFPQHEFCCKGFRNITFVATVRTGLGHKMTLDLMVVEIRRPTCSNFHKKTEARSSSNRKRKKLHERHIYSLVSKYKSSQRFQYQLHTGYIQTYFRV